MKTKPYPDAVNPGLVGEYSAVARAGGGFVWDEVLEYRVWCHPERGAEDLDAGSDYYHAFATYAEALEASSRTLGADEPLALILQREYIDEPEPGRYVHVVAERVAEWPVEFLRRPRRTPRTIPDFLSPTAPANRLDILRGLAQPADGSETRMTPNSTADRICQLLASLPPDYRRPPVGAAELASLERWLHSTAGIDLPDEYRELLRASDGVQIDNDLVLSAEDCRWANEALYRDARYRRHVLVGHEGNVASWAYAADSARFVICQFGNPAVVIESHASLCELIESRS